MEKEPMTPQGLQKLKDDLKHYKTVERPQNVRDIEVARAHGDLKENAEYHAAKDKQGHINAHLEQIEDAIARAEVVDPSTIKVDRVVFGAKLKLLDVEHDEELNYQIVGRFESDLKNGRISYDAPLARLLLGKHVGDTVVFKSPKGEKEYEVLAISYQ